MSEKLNVYVNVEELKDHLHELGNLIAVFYAEASLLAGNRKTDRLKQLNQAMVEKFKEISNALG